MDGPGASKEDFEFVEDDDGGGDHTDDGGGDEDGDVRYVEDCLVMLILFKGAFPWSVLELPFCVLAWSFIDI